MIKAVFFDLDGTLVDSMPAHEQAWTTVLGELGIQLTALYVQLHEGEKADDTFRRLLSEHGLHYSDAQMHALLERKRALYRAAAPAGLIPEARALVQACAARGLMCAIVTGSVRSNLNGVVPPEDVRLFRHIITADDYARGKPAPDPYLLAVEKSGLSAPECLALENAPLGIQSARAAGVLTVAITTTLPARYLSNAHHVVTAYDHVLGYL